MDTVGNFITKIRNSLMSNNNSTISFCSITEQEITKVLIRLGFLTKCKVMSYRGKKFIFLKMKYVGKEPVIRSLVRISKPGKRLYSKSARFFEKNISFGILTTSKGVLNSYESLVLNQGGEVMFNVF